MPWGTRPRRSGTCASCTSGPAFLREAAARTGARPRRPHTHETPCNGTPARGPCARTGSGRRRRRGTRKRRSGRASSCIPAATTAPAAPRLGRGSARSSGPGRRGRRRRRCTCASCTCGGSHSFFGKYDGRGAPRCLCCSKGSTLASLDFGWVWVSEKAAKSAGRDASGSSSSVAGALDVRGSGGGSSLDGSSCFDSYAGSGCSGVSAGADPTGLAARSFHMRGSRIANLPRSRVDAHCSRCAVRDAALASVIKGQILQVPSGS